MKTKKIFSIVGLVLFFSLVFLSPSKVKAAPCSETITATESCDSITQYGITMTFDDNYTVGQFVMGDYYVVDPGSGVTVLSATPGWTGSLHGSMKNPVSGAGQGFVDHGYDFDPTLRIDYPVSLVSKDSLVASVSQTTTGVPAWDGSNDGTNDWTEDVLILSVVSEAPSPGTFRPAPTDRSQALYNTSQIKTEYLANKSTSEMTLPVHAGFTTTSYFERGVARPWIMFGDDFQARTIHPKQNMNDYHGEIGPFLSELEIMLMSDLITAPMLHGYLQIVIDTYYANNQDSSNWAATMVIGGLLLGDSDIYNYWINNPTIRTQRGHEKFFYPDEGGVIYYDSVYSSSIVPRGQTWTGYVHPASGKVPMFSKQVTEVQASVFLEHLHPSEWQCGGICSTINQCYSWDYYIKYDVHPLIGMVLATQLIGETAGLNAKAMLAHDPMWDYADRWMTENWKTGEFQGTGRTKYEEVIYYTGCGQGSYYLDTSGSSFTDDMWDAYRDYYGGSEASSRFDVDNNSNINTTDALLTLRNSLGLSMASTAWQVSATTGDVDCNGASNSTDALLILRYSLGLSMTSTAWCES